MAAKSRKERHFQTEINRSVERYNGLLIPLPDVFSPTMRFMDPKPFDLACLDPNGHFHGIELKFETLKVKQTKTGRKESASLAFSRIEPHQWTALQKCEERGSWGWLITNFAEQRTRQNHRQLEKTLGPKSCQAYALRFRQVEKAQRSIGRKSIPLIWFQRWGIQLPEILDTEDRDSKNKPRRYWDLRTLFLIAANERRLRNPQCLCPRCPEAPHQFNANETGAAR